MTICYAGAGKQPVHIPEEILPLEGFLLEEDEIYARVLYVKKDNTWLVVSLEMTSLRDYEIKTIKEKLQEQTGLDQDMIWICVTHNFSVPHVRSQQAIQQDETIRWKNDRYCQAIETAVLQAAQQAIQTACVAKIQYATGQCDINVKRDMWTAQGWWIGQDLHGFHDTSVPIVLFQANDHTTIGTLYSYDMQSSVMDHVMKEDGTRSICTDITGVSSRYIEDTLDTIALYVIGAAGDQAPKKKVMQTIVNEQGLMGERNHKDMGRTWCIEQGNLLGKVVCSCVLNRPFQTDGKLELLQETLIFQGQNIPNATQALVPAKTYDFSPQGTRSSPVYLMLLGDLAIIGVQPELNSITASQIRQASPYPFTMVLTMVNGGAKYMADEESYDRITYEAMNSAFAKGSAERLRNHIIKVLQERRCNPK